MNLQEKKYNQFALVREMMETVDIVKKFDPSVVDRFVPATAKAQGVFLTGEGSSRLFPAKRAIYSSLKKGYGLKINTDAATQSIEYNLNDYAVFAASNSGQTTEVISFANAMREAKNNTFFGLTANLNTKLESLAVATHVLSCGKEDAVAATKSVVEQGLFYDALLRKVKKEQMSNLDGLANAIEKALTAPIEKSIIDKIKEADMIYFAGRNNGVAEELALKTNEITRKKSAYLEVTFALHGIEEVMNPNEVLIWVDPYESEEEEFNKRLVKGVGIGLVAISSKSTIFPTVSIPSCDEYDEYVQLAAGWNILVEVGVGLGINLDKPQRARKIGNEYIGG